MFPSVVRIGVRSTLTGCKFIGTGSVGLTKHNLGLVSQCQFAVGQIQQIQKHNLSINMHCYDHDGCNNSYSHFFNRGTIYTSIRHHGSRRDVRRTSEKRKSGKGYEGESDDELETDSDSDIAGDYMATDDAPTRAKKTKRPSISKRSSGRRSRSGSLHDIVATRPLSRKSSKLSKGLELGLTQSTTTLARGDSDTTPLASASASASASAKGKASIAGLYVTDPSIARSRRRKKIGRADDLYVPCVCPLWLLYS